MKRAPTDPPDNMEITESMAQWLKANGLTLNEGRNEVPKMLDWNKMNGKRRSDWPATFRSWMRKYMEIRDRSANGTNGRFHKPVTGTHTCKLCDPPHKWECVEVLCMVSHRESWPCPTALARLG